MNTLFNMLHALLPSAAILLAAAWLERQLRDFSAAQLAVVEWLPPLLLATALALALRFTRGRIFFALLNLLLGYAALRWYAPASAIFPGVVIFACVALFLPLNLIASQYLDERGTRAVWRQTRFIVLSLQILFVIVVAEARLEPLAYLFTWQVFDAEQLDWTAIPQPALLALIIGLFLSYGRMHAEPTLQRAAFFAAMLALAMALQGGDSPATVVAWFAAAGPILGIAVVRESWNLAYIDQLTELPGRRALEEALQKLDNPHAIAMVDVDFFKKFNDTYGHHVGDEVLRMVAFQLRDVGGGGKAFRYGGEEFTLLFPGLGAKEAKPFLETLREQIADARFEIRQRGRRREEHEESRRQAPATGPISVTISIGLAESNDKLGRPAAVLTAADKALYRAKKRGRNRVCR